jgi:Phosphotransferase enzyme family
MTVAGEGTSLAIPADWDAVSPAWMTSALRGSYPDVEVSAVDVVLRDDGTNRRARLALTYARGAGPETVFLKAADPAHTKLNARTGGVFNEPRLFLAGVELPLDHPAVHLVLIDEPRLDFLMVMEDVGQRGGDPRDATRPLTVDQAADGVRGLARLHSRYWGDRLRRTTTLGWVEPFVAWTGMGRGIDVGIERAGATIPGPVARLGGDRINATWARFVSTLHTGPPTLLHGDPHIGNTYVLPGDQVGFLDWQVLRRGNHALDLGYFLQGALTVEDRRAAEGALVDEYHRTLDLPDGERPSRDEAWRRYRAAAAHGLAIWLATAASTWQRPEVSLALAARYAAAFADLEPEAAIDEVVGRARPSPGA